MGIAKRNHDPTSQRMISLLTDFGLTDPFVAEMKAVIFSICPKTTIVDISHLVEKFNIRMGSFLLAGAAPYFPAGTIHVAVVDPGVGSERRAIVVETHRSLYVGPDNGLLITAAETDGIRRVYELTNRAIMRGEVSATFHGRDVFAPAAAHLASGLSPRESGSEIADYVRPSYAQTSFHGDAVTCEVFYMDGFGNIVTSLRGTQLVKLNLKDGQRVRMSVGGRRFPIRFVRTYADLGENEFGLLVGSHGFVEIACREKSASKRVRARIGMDVEFSGGSAYRSPLTRVSARRRKYP